MKYNIYNSKVLSAVRFLSIILICLLFSPGGAVWAGLQPPLKNIPVPEPANLNQFLRTLADGVTIDPAAREAATALGKALFWDMQVGSDGQTACATCHYRAGADPVVGTLPKETARRHQGQLHPGPNNTFDIQSGPSNTLTAADFPFFQITPPTGRVGVDTIPDIFGAVTATVTRNFDDVTGSQGVHRIIFTGINPGNPVDSGTQDPALPFSDARQVTGRNSPSAINSVFNFTNFWDGRASNIFNGVNPFGEMDSGATIWINIPGQGIVQQAVRIPNASLASAAVGPPLDPVMMSFSGRTFPELGRKMLSLTPLGQQIVDPLDSVLGGLANPGGGLTRSYDQIIRDAFNDNLTSNATVTGIFSQIQANFSLFFGLSIQLYLSTLVSDRTPFDRFQLGNQNALNTAAQEGLATFDNRCASCHAGSEFTAAVVGNTVVNDVPIAFTTNTNHRLIQQRLTIPSVGFPVFATFDAGFHNTGVRATADNIGRGGTALGFPLSFTRLAQFEAAQGLPFDTPDILPPIPLTQRDVVQGSFKTPGLRNVELTAPYMHNGSMFNLDQVVEFYTRGGNFPDNPEMSIAPIGNLRGDALRRAQLVEFLKGLTDDRVRSEWAPFDHPELTVPNGTENITLPATGGIPTVLPTLTVNPIPSPTILTILATGGTVTDGSTLNDKVTVAVTLNNLAPAAAIVTGINWSHTLTGLVTLGTNTITVTATDVTGGETTVIAPIFLLPSATITGAPRIASNQTSATLTIGGNGVASYQFKLDNGLFGADTPTTTPITLTGLSEGLHAVSVIGAGTDASGTLLRQPEATPTTASWIVKSIPPVLTLNPVAAASRTSLTIGGTVELGIVPSVRANTVATIGPVTVIGGSGIATWSCTVSGLGRGTTDITVTAIDIASNVTSQAASVRIILPDGDFRDRGRVDISDALKALRIAVGTDSASLPDMLHGDVAPLVNNIPAPDGTISVDDALIILKKVAGLVNF